MSHTFAIDDVVVVGIDHRRIGVGGNAQHPVEGTLTEDEPCGLRLKQHVVGLGILRNAHQRVAADGRIIQETDILNCLVSLQLFRDL